MAPDLSTFLAFFGLANTREARQTPYSTWSGEFMGSRWGAWGTGFFCTTLWLAFAFMVAFPKETMTMDFARLFQVFFDGEGPDSLGLERLFIPLLLFVDIVISWFLGHFRPSPKAVPLCLLAGLLYGVVAGVAPFYADSHTAANHAGLFLVAFLCLSTVRMATFVKPRSFVLMKRSEDTGEFTSEGGNGP